MNFIENKIYEDIQDYTCTELISRYGELSEAENFEVNRILILLKKHSIQDIDDYIKLKKENYEKISKVEAYLLHYISIFNSHRKINDENNKKLEDNNCKQMHLTKE